MAKIPGHAPTLTRAPTHRLRIRAGAVHSDVHSKRARVGLLATIVGVSAIALPSCGGAASRAPRPTTPRASSKTPPTSGPRRVTPSTTGGTTAAPSAATGALRGDVVTIDPGHNGGNHTDPLAIDTPVWNGREEEACDTTGTETDAGYTEAQFNFNVAQDLTADLEGEGATVVETRTTNAGVGPCITQRAAIGNNAHARAAVSIHADGGPPDGRGFAILEPVADVVNDAIIGPSQTLGADVRAAFLSGTTMPVSSYDGADGVAARDDLGGLNLSTVPKVLVECGNMRNATDAALLVSTAWQRQAARAIAAGITTFLEARPAGPPPAA